MKRTILVFGLLILALLVLFELSKRTYLSGDTSIEIIIAVIALVFFFIGIYINKKSLNKNTPIAKEVNHKKIKELNISNREYEVLCEIAKGLSNQEIANKLFVSESTIKTHVSNILVKLNAKRRTQAIQISKELQLLPF
jgi:DNA-binding NarL/FixJ family response regulator